MADVINRPKAKEVLKIRCHTAHHQRGNCIGPAEDPGKRDDRGRMGEGERHTSAIVAPNAGHTCSTATLPEFPPWLRFHRLLLIRRPRNVVLKHALRGLFGQPSGNWKGDLLVE